MKKIISFILILIVLLIGCSNKEKDNNNIQYSKTEEIIGTVISGTIYGENSKEALCEAFERAEYIEKIMSVKIQDSEISNLNNTAFNNEVKVSNELFYVLEKAMYYSKLTEGAFDFTIGGLIDLWAIGTENAKVPKHEEIINLLELDNYKNIQINSENKTVKFLKDTVKIDLGAIAKGYVADEMKKVICEKYNIHSGILNLGGNVIAIGKKNNNSLWKVGICNPINNSYVIATLESSDETVVTSGNYERYFIENGMKYHHILDPNTGYPANSGLISTTIVTESSIDADALSTATYVLGLDKSKELVESIDNVEGVFITEDMVIDMTSGINNRIKVIQNDT